MIHVVKSAAYRDGKAKEGRESGAKIAAFLNENFSEVNVELVRNLNGPVNQGHLVFRCESLAVYEEYEKKLNAHPSWPELLAENLGCLIESTITTNFFATVPSFPNSGK